MIYSVNNSLLSFKMLIVAIYYVNNFNVLQHVMQISGADPGFKVKGGGGAHLKKLRRAEGGATIFGVFRVKNHDFTPKKSFFSILFRGGGGGAPGAPPTP